MISDDPAARTLRGVVRACDLVITLAMVAIALAGTWLAATDRARWSTVAAMWALPGLHVGLSALGRGSVRAELTRAAVKLPLAMYLYIAEEGVLREMWIPALVTAVGVGLALGIATRRSALGNAVAAVYAAGLVVAAVAHTGSIDGATLDDVLGILVTGAVVSLVASRLGATLDEVSARTAELNQAQKLESVGRLAAGIAHEINTPIQFVGDSISFVRDAMADVFGLVAIARTSPDELAAAIDDIDLPYLEGNVPEALDLAAEGLARVATIVRSMKEFARPDQREMVATSLDHVIESTLTMARNECKYVADVETAFAEIGPVQCHAGELGQAILNIVVNAAHAIGDANKGRGTIRVATARDGDEVLIDISDTGGGIPEDVRDRLFDPFFTTKEVGRGSGQGLAIARSMVVDKHRGRLTFDTQIGVGTTFHIRIPIYGQPASQAA